MFKTFMRFIDNFYEWLADYWLVICVTLAIMAVGMGGGYWLVAEASVNEAAIVEYFDRPASSMNVLDIWILTFIPVWVVARSVDNVAITIEETK